MKVSSDKCQASYCTYEILNMHVTKYKKIYQSQRQCNIHIGSRGSAGIP